MRHTIIADASHCHETGAAGYGFWIASERRKMPGGGSVREPVDTSAAAEAIALVNAVYAGIKHEIIQEGDHVLMQTDCQAAIDLFSNANRPKVSKDERTAKAKLFELKREHKFTVSFRHVKGHTNRPGARYTTNRLCDERAKAGMRRVRTKLRKQK